MAGCDVDGVEEGMDGVGDMMGAGRVTTGGFGRLGMGAEDGRSGGRGMSASFSTEE